jgi:hypothetical protein
MKPSKLLTALNVLSKVQSGDEQTSCHLPPPPVSDYHKSPQMVFLITVDLSHIPKKHSLSTPN